MKVSAIILAGGSGTRLANHTKSDTPKQYLEIGGKPVLSYSVDVFLDLPFVDEIIVVTANEWMEYCKVNVIDPLMRQNHANIKLVEGGSNRQESSFCGVKNATLPYIMIHDGARPFVRVCDIEKLYDTLCLGSSAILGVPVTDTIKSLIKVNETAYVDCTIPRDTLMSAATPQAFRRDLLLAAHELAAGSNFIGTDDASLLEYMGESVVIIQGSSMNIKITTHEDWVYADFLVRVHRQSISKKDFDPDFLSIEKR